MKYTFSLKYCDDKNLTIFKRTFGSPLEDAVVARGIETCVLTKIPMESSFCTMRACNPSVRQTAYMNSSLSASTSHQPI